MGPSGVAEPFCTRNRYLVGVIIQALFCQKTHKKKQIFPTFFDSCRKSPPLARKVEGIRY